MIKEGRTHFQIGDNKNLFDFTYVSNVVDAHLLAADKLSDPATLPSVGGEVFIVTNGQPWPFWDFQRAVWKEMGHVSQRKPTVLSRNIALIIAYISEWIAWITGKPALFTRFRVKFTCANRWFNISKAREVLGYEPSVDYEEGIRKMVEVSRNDYFLRLNAYVVKVVQQKQTRLANIQVTRYWLNLLDSKSYMLCLKYESLNNCTMINSLGKGVYSQLGNMHWKVDKNLKYLINFPKR